MARPTWDTTWLNVAKVISQRSLCSRAQVGAVIVDPDNRIVATGYNGPPSGFGHGEKSCVKWCQRSKDAEEQLLLSPTYDDCPSLHAEANALMVCDRVEREGGTIFVTSHVCFTCAKLIANSGLKRLVVDPDKPARHRQPQRSYEFLKRMGIEWYVRPITG